MGTSKLVILKQLDISSLSLDQIDPAVRDLLRDGHYNAQTTGFVELNLSTLWPLQFKSESEFCDALIIYLTEVEAECMVDRTNNPNLVYKQELLICCRGVDRFVLAKYAINHMFKPGTSIYYWAARYDSGRQRWVAASQN